jgi:hypothetical protein
MFTTQAGKAAGGGLAVVLALALAAQADAHVTAVSGQVEQIGQPADAQIGNLESDTFARAWDEAQGYRLSAPLAVNATPAGPPATIPAGTVVSSHMIHSDKAGTAGAADFIGSVTFSTPIVGIVFGDGKLAASDFLGAPTLFSASRGLEPGSDLFTASGDTESIAFHTQNLADEARVLTRGYAFAGFYRPVDNPPVVNTVKSGSAVPVKFGLGGFQGYDIFAPGSPSSAQTGCVAGAPVDDIETTVTAGGSSLSYDAASDTYTYVWKTDKAWAGQCRTFTVTTADGGAHTARFQLK